MNFPGVGLIPIRWYFVDDAPFLSVPTVFNSRNWLSDHNQEYPAGEVLGASRPYANGKGPNLNCNGSAGSDAAWEGESVATLYLVNGFNGQQPATWIRQRTWRAVARWPGHYASTWTRPRSWRARLQWAGMYHVWWTRPRSWRAAVKTLDRFASTWRRPRSWSAAEKTTAHFASTWTRPRSWTAVEQTVDNVISFLCQNLTAAGTTQGTAAAIASDTVNATSSSPNQGVILPSGCYRVIVTNGNSPGGNSINVYPPSGAKISALSTNQASPLAQGSTVMFLEVTSTQWRVVALS